MNKNTEQLIEDIDVFASNVLTRMLSKQKLKPFGGDRRKYKYRVGLLNSFANLEAILEDFEASVLGSSGTSIFTSIQHLANAKRQIAKIASILNAFGSEEGGTIETLDNVNEEKVEDNNLSEIIKDFEINRLNFDYSESSKFTILEDLVIGYNSGNHSLANQIKENYKQLVNELSKGKPATSLEDVLVGRVNDENNLESNASFSNWVKKWYGKTRHNMSMFDETSPVRLDVSKHAKDALEEVQVALNSLEKDLDPFELFDKIANINLHLTSANEIMKPLIQSIKGSSFGDTFLGMIDKGKLTDFPTNLSKKDKKSLETYLRTREFKDMLEMYSGKK